MTVWCICGHDYESHDLLCDPETDEIIESWCTGIDGKRTHDITADPASKTMVLKVTCPCRSFEWQRELDKEWQSQQDELST